MREKNPTNGTDKIFNKIIKENPKLKKALYIHMQEAHKTPNRQDLKRKSPWHIIIKT